MSVENRVAAIRRARGVGATELAKRTGVSRQTIHAIEAGAYVPNTAVALRLARELEVPVEELFRLEEAREAPEAELRATLLGAAGTEPGRAVTLAHVGDQVVAVPAGSVPYYLPEADGVLTASGRRAGAASVRLLDGPAALPKRLVIAGCDPAMGLLARMAERLSGVEIVTVPASSSQSLEWLKQGLVHMAGSHLEDPESGEFNLPYLRRLMPREELTVVTFARWEEGFVVARGNPLGIRAAADLGRSGVRLTNRETGSGSRALLDTLLQQAGVAASRVAGYGNEAAGHLAAASTVAGGQADCCLATPSAARAFGLDFVPLHAERFDLVARRESVDLPGVRDVLDTLQRGALRRKLETLAGYETGETGRVVT
jgi:molybdate-binding protein/DNA-binding XRE family transcriptional regulator